MKRGADKGKSGGRRSRLLPLRIINMTAISGCLSNSGCLLQGWKRTGFGRKVRWEVEEDDYEGKRRQRKRR